MSPPVIPSKIKSYLKEDSLTLKFSKNNFNICRYVFFRTVKKFYIEP